MNGCYVNMNKIPRASEQLPGRIQFRYTANAGLTGPDFDMHMKTIRGIKIGGLQSKIFSLILFLIVGLIGTYTVVFGIHMKHLSAIVQRTGAEQQASIKDTSESAMEAVMSAFLKRSTGLQAYIADDLFSEVRGNVTILQTVAEQYFGRADTLTPHAFAYPDAANAGKASVQMQHERGVDPNASRGLGIAANMSEIMLAMFESCDKLNSCFVATTDGCILFVDDRADVYIQDDGSVAYATEIRTRPWYRQAVEAGELIFTNVEADTFTGILGIVCAAPVYRDGKLVAVVGADIFLTSISNYVNDTATEGGFLCVVDKSGQVLFSPKTEGIFKPELSSRALDLRQSGNPKLAAFITRALTESTGVTEIEIEGRECYLSGAPMPSVGWTVISVVDKGITQRPTASMLAKYDEINNNASAAYREGAKRSVRTVIAVIVIIVLIALIAAQTTGWHIVKPLNQLTRHINAQKNGDGIFILDDSYRTGDEIEILAESFNALTKRTQDYIDEIITITAEKKRIGTELALASRIQADMLPNIFPPFPERAEFDIYASMDPAKEVGGDFYDFFLIDDTHLGLVMADVSGKGVPAALFMMISKILVQNLAMTLRSPAKVLQEVNRQLCANNREEMFVTVWFGVLDTVTGKVTAANAGHEYPVLMPAGGKFALVKDKHGFVIGGMEGVQYKEYELTLTPGSRLFVYTDGVPEATNAQNEMFGTERMLEALNREPAAVPKATLQNVKDAVDSFVLDAEQFDDMTMLCVEYKGQNPCV